VNTDLPRLFTLPAAQAELERRGAKVSIWTLRREAERGRLRLTRIGRKVFIRMTTLRNTCHAKTKASRHDRRLLAQPTLQFPRLVRNLVRSSHSTDATRIAWHN
jgi:hypothetical protein